MFFPYGDDQVHGGHRPIVSYTLILANVLAFIWQLGDPAGIGYATTFGAIPAQVVQGDGLHTILTSMFLHGGISHLLGNMLFLWIFADNIEATVGSPVFLLFYALGGAAATIAHVVIDPGSPIPVVGASGAISAVLGAYVVLYPRSRIKTFVFIFPTRIPAIFFLGVWFYMQLSSGMQSLGLASGEGGVAWWAHIGGFAFGLAAGIWMRREYRPGRLRVR